MSYLFLNICNFFSNFFFVSKSFNEVLDKVIHLILESPFKVF